MCLPCDAGRLSYLFDIQEYVSFVFGNIGAGEIIVIALVVLLLFGGKKIPELMKGLGKGVRSFKEGMNEIEKDIQSEDSDAGKK